MTDSQIIHEARGLCWHELETVNELKWCKLCQIGKLLVECPVITPNPDYTDPAAYFEAMMWAREQTWWRDFIYSIQIDIALDTLIGITHIILDPETGTHALAGYIKEEVQS